MHLRRRRRRKQYDSVNLMCTIAHFSNLLHTYIFDLYTMYAYQKKIKTEKKKRRKCHVFVSNHIYNFIWNLFAACIKLKKISISFENIVYDRTDKKRV